MTKHRISNQRVVVLDIIHSDPPEFTPLFTEAWALAPPEYGDALVTEAWSS